MSNRAQTNQAFASKPVILAAEALFLVSWRYCGIIWRKVSGIERSGWQKVDAKDAHPGMPSTDERDSSVG
jgi:hypothetical protein